MTTAPSPLAAPVLRTGSPASAPVPAPLAVLLGAAMLTWPALLNRYPLLYPDGVSYLQDGGPTARAVFLHQLDGYSAMRSEIYSLGILPFHAYLTLWPIVALNALLTSWVLWLVVRATVRTSGPPIRPFLLLTAFLSVLTTISWYVSLVMPDILGSLLYLTAWLLVFARDTLSRRELWALSAFAVWATAAHATHLMLALGLCLLLALLWQFRWRPLIGNARGLAHFAALLAIAAAALVALHAWVYGRPSLEGNRPPYLMARIVADGPGATYLHQHCATLDWAICAYAGHLPDNDDDFLWADDGVWSSADEPTRQRLLREEMPLVRATLRAYPREQAAVSFANFSHQLDDFGVNDFDNNDWMQQALYETIPSSRTAYPRTLEARSIVPSEAFTQLQRWIVFPCALALAALLPWLRSRCRNRLLGLVAVVVPILLANAFVTAVLSSSDSRYQARVIWLLPLTAALAALDFLRNRRATSA